MEGMVGSVRARWRIFRAALGVGGDGEIARRKFAGGVTVSLAYWSPTPSKESRRERWK